MKNNGVLSKLAPVRIVILCIQVVMTAIGSSGILWNTTVHCFQQRLAIATCIHNVTILMEAILLDIPLFFL
jgi:hypothetical protein